MFLKSKIVTIALVIAICWEHVQVQGTGENRKRDKPESSSDVPSVTCSVENEKIDYMKRAYHEDGEPRDYVNPSIPGVVLRTALVNMGDYKFQYNAGTENITWEGDLPFGEVKLNVVLSASENSNGERLGNPINVRARNLNLNYDGNNRISIYAIRPPNSLKPDERKSSAAVLLCNGNNTLFCSIFCYAEGLPILKKQ